MRADRSGTVLSLRQNRVVAPAGGGGAGAQGGYPVVAMLDPRIYRMGLVPVVLAVIVVAFSLSGQPSGLTTSLAPSAYSGADAYATMISLARQFPRRQPGSLGDRRLADLVASELRGDGFSVSTPRFGATTPVGTRSLENVIATRAGQENGSLVVVAPRDALGTPAASQLSATAVLLQLAQVLSGETLQHTLILAPVSGSVGGAGAVALARTLPRPVDAVLVLGDLAAPRVRQPVVVPWSDAQRLAPPLLRSTVAQALSSQAGVASAGSSLLGQLAHLTLPMAPTAQAPLDAAGLPAVLVALSGERPPAAHEQTSSSALAGTGAAMLEAVTALDGQPSLSPPAAYLTVAGNSVPGWAVRLLALALIVPVLMASIDGVARAPRRGAAILSGVGWVLAGSLPCLAAALLAVLAVWVGAIPAAPPLPLGAGAIRLDDGQLAFLAGLACLIVAGSVWLRSPAGPLSGSGASGERDAGPAAALLSVMCVLALILWLANPFAALLLAPALHLWLWVVAPEVRLPLGGSALLLLGGLALPLLIGAEYCLTLGLGPLQAAWSWVLLVGGGGYGALGVLVWSVFVACATGVLAIALSAARQPRPEPVRVTIRGPIGYAGPGSLGGTRSALRR